MTAPWWSIDNARKMIGKTIDISVTSVLQTTAGKMIFGKWDERATGRHDSKSVRRCGDRASGGGHGPPSTRQRKIRALADRSPISCLDLARQMYSALPQPWPPIGMLARLRPVLY